MNPKPRQTQTFWAREKCPFSRAISLAGIAIVLCQAAPVAAQASTLHNTDVAGQAAAIEIARAGRYDEAIQELNLLRATYPESAELLFDEIVVRNWAEQDEQVRALAANLDPAEAPVHVQVAVGKSLRNLRLFEDSIEWYRSAVEADADDVEARLGLAFAYADAGKFVLAEQTLSPLRSVPEHSTSADLALAYVQKHAGMRLQAITSYDRVLARDPQHQEALRGKVLLLRSLLLPSEALALARSHPGILSDAEIERLKADEIALQVRYGTEVPYPAAQQRAMIDRAIAALETYLAAGTADPQTELALRFDRIIALAERGSSAEAVEAFEQLPADHPELTAPVLAAAGKAYLDIREPEMAHAVLDRAAALDPEDVELQFALFYAHAERGELNRALLLAEQLAASIPATLRPSGQPNPDRLRAEILVGIALAYSDRLGDAQAHLEQLLAEAPNNPDLRHELANIYRWRGWYDRSLFEYQQVLAVEPEMLEARVGRARTELDRSRFGAVASEVAALNREFANEPAVERLTSAWQAHNSSELRVEASTHTSSGVTFGSDQYQLGLTWLTAPIKHRLRASLSTRDSFADFPEGDSRRQRAAAGLHYQYGRWLATTEVSGNRDGGNDIGALASVGYRLSDFWVLSSAVELNSDSVPMRGHRVGVENDLLRIGARYAPHEELSLELGATSEQLSDDNERKLLWAEGRRRVINRPKVVVEVIGEAFVGERLTDQVAYYSPLRDAGVFIGAETQLPALRRYERRMTHIFRAEVGTYDQSGYDRGTVWRAAYMMPLELGPRFAAWFGIWRSRMFYDGAKEYSTTASATMQFRF